MFTATTSPYPDDPGRTVVVATSTQRGLTRFA